MKDYSEIDFHKFINMGLQQNGNRIVPVTAELMENRLNDFMGFVNGVFAEYAEVYKWKPVDEKFFLNPLKDKWKFSFTILDEKDNIHFLNFSSVYVDHIHNHCTFAGKSSRGKNFAKYHILKLCQAGLDAGFTYQEGYWPKNNNRSIILYLKMGWQITHIRDEQELGMSAELEKLRNQTYELIQSGK
ncbi:MAG: hypothetical protein K8I03_07060 [Ignavibacteria bacterium]|nr:hypothetical protein [Ignavibacteria bacterium]